MKPLAKIVSLVACALIALYATGCTTGAGMIEASSTQVKIQTGKNKGMAITLPKELDTTDLHLKINPKTGEITLDAAKLKSSSQGIIESAGVAQAQANQAMFQTVNTALSALLPILARAAGVPAVASSEQRVESIADPEPVAAEPAPAPEPKPKTPDPITITPIEPLNLSALNLSAK